ncbi:MAG: PilW family protein [Nitrospiraceae bacterium]
MGDIKHVQVLCERGFTLIEIMISLVITTVIVGAGYTVLTMTHKATIANEQTVGTQQNARTAMELIARDIKLSGFRMLTSPSVPVGGAGSDCAPGGVAAAISPTDADAATSNDKGPDSLALVVPKSDPTWTLNGVVPSAGSSSFSTIALSSAAAVTSMQTEGMKDGAGAYVTIGGVLTLPVASSIGATITFGTTTSLPVTFPDKTPVQLLQCVKYSVGTTAAECGNAGPCLLRKVDSGTDPAVTTNIVDGVEDLQFAYACDGCNALINSGLPNRVIDDFNGNNTFDQADFQTDRVWAFGTFDPATIRMVQVNIVARQGKQDQGLGEGKASGTLTAAPLQVSDHLHSADTAYNPSTYKAFRRRLLTRTVDTRNMDQ